MYMYMYMYMCVCQCFEINKDEYKVGRMHTQLTAVR